MSNKRKFSVDSEANNDFDKFLTVSEASDASAEESPKKDYLTEPVIFKKKSRNTNKGQKSIERERNKVAKSIERES